ncbi:hypothetical protein CMK18_22375 [Candidatus Poribacteria bacterium]|nr:hypothetical protein [Candidatus Poribacteria bacterium]
MKTVGLKLPMPHSKIQELIFRFCFLQPETREVWVACGTKFGKTMSGTGGMSAFFHVMKFGIIRHVAPIYSQSKIGMRYCEKILPSKPFYKSNKSEHTITPIDPKRSNRFEFWHGQNPEDLEGEAVYRYLLDEAAKMKRQVYDSAVTTMTKTRGKLAATSTPRGKNWFFAKCQDARERQNWCLKKGKVPTHIFIHAPTSANPFIPRESIQEAKKSLPDRLFRQFYEAEFTDSGNIFNFRPCIFGKELSFDSAENQLWLDETQINCQVVIGADWGKTEDYTVFTAFDIVRRKMIGFMRFRFVDYLTAVTNLVWFSKNYDDVLEVSHDKTGIGNVIDDLMSHTNLPYEGVVFTNREKSKWVNNLMIAFERGIIKIPNWYEMIVELESYEVVVSDVGNFKYSAASGFHDDIVSSMLLGWNCLEQNTDTVLDVITLDQLKDINLEEINIAAPKENFKSWKAK